MKVKDILKKTREGIMYFRHSKDRKLIKRNTDAELLCYKIVESREKNLILWSAFVFKSEYRDTKYYFFINGMRQYGNSKKKVLDLVKEAKVESKSDVPEKLERHILFDQV